MSSGKEALVVCSEKMSAGISVWDLENGEQLLHIPTCASPPHGMLCLRNHILVASQLQTHRPFFFGGGAIFFWPLNKPQAPHRSYPIEAIGPIASTKDGLYLVGGAPSGNAYVWEVTSGKLVRNWHAHHKSLNCLAFSSDDSLLISGSEDGVVCVWSMISLLDMADLQACGDLPSFHTWSEHGSSITGLLPMSGWSGLVLISSSLDGTCKVWDLVSGRLLQTLTFSVSVTTITLDPGEQLLFAGTVDGRIFINALNSGLQENPTVVSEDESLVLYTHGEAITALTFSLRGLLLISASKDCTACLWDVMSWKEIRRFNHVKGHITNVVVIPQSSLSAVLNQKNVLMPHVSLLDKAPQLHIASEGTLTLLPTYCSLEDQLLTTSGFRTSSLLNKQILDLEQGRTPEAIQLKVETGVENRLWAVTMTKHLTTLNKHLQTRLLDMAQHRLCHDLAVASRRKPKTSEPDESTQPPT